MPIDMAVSKLLQPSTLTLKDPLVGHPNGLIPSHLGLKVASQETQPIVLKKKVTTTY